MAYGIIIDAKSRGCSARPSYSPERESSGRFRLVCDSLVRCYKLIRCRVLLDEAGVERSSDVPLTRDEIALVILSLANGDAFRPVQIQKALFLASDKVGEAFRADSHYEFQPYDYGPFDHRVYSDIERLEGRGLAVIAQPLGSRWKTYAATEAGIAEGRRLSGVLTQDQIKILQRIVELVRGLSFNELVSAIYKAYPPMRARSVFRD
jgi:hypothetical protein